MYYNVVLSIRVSSFEAMKMTKSLKAVKMKPGSEKIMFNFA